MRNRLVHKIVFLSIVIFTVSSCEYYLGLNQQPDFVEDSMEEGLNIFGIIRPDTSIDANTSFVYVQQLYSVLDVPNFDIIPIAEVSLNLLENNEVTEIIEFPLTYPDAFFEDTLYRPPVSFQPMAGQHYQLTCEHPDFETAVGETIIPLKPRLVENSLQLGDQSISFTIEADSLTHMVDVYLVNQETSFYIDRQQTFQDQVSVDHVLPFDPHGFTLKIFAYDANMSHYMAGANTSVNFNKYRTTLSTLDSGYGVFGSVNFTEILLPLAE